MTGKQRVHQRCASIAEATAREDRFNRQLYVEFASLSFRRVFGEAGDKSSAQVLRLLFPNGMPRNVDWKELLATLRGLHFRDREIEQACHLQRGYIAQIRNGGIRNPEFSKGIVLLLFLVHAISFVSSTSGP